jgi:methyltransferase family protein
MDPDQIRERIANHEWYQTIPLAEGISTPGKRSSEYLRRKLEALEFPEAFAGASVLDIGTKEGFFATEALRRGAKRVVGIDISTDAARKFALVKEITGHAADFRHMSVSDLGPSSPGIFDYVFFFSVFHHLRHPLFDLDRIASVTGAVALMEVYILDDDRLGPVPALYRGRGESGIWRLVPTRRFLIEALERVGFKEVHFLGRTSRRTFREIPVEVERVGIRAVR